MRCDFHVIIICECYFGSDERVHFKRTVMHSANIKLQVEDFFFQNILRDNLCFFDHFWLIIYVFISNRKDKSTFWNLLHISPVRNASGKVNPFIPPYFLLPNPLCYILRVDTKPGYDMYN